MILARITQAIRTQNWFAVILEFVIVIAGVVIGFQVTAWNAERAERLTEAEIIGRLHDEIIGVGQSRWDWAAGRESTRELLLAASQKLYGNSDEILSLSECGAIAQSHIFNSPTLTLPVLAELESTGDLDLIANPEIRDAITTFLMAISWAHEMDAAINHEIWNLSIRFPDLMNFVVPEAGVEWVPHFDGSARCDTEAMRSHRGFLNALADNISKSQFYMIAGLDGPNEAFLALHDAVDAELGLTHEDDEAAP